MSTAQEVRLNWAGYACADSLLTYIAYVHIDSTLNYCGAAALPILTQLRRADRDNQLIVRISNEAPLFDLRRTDCLAYLAWVPFVWFYVARHKLLWKTKTLRPM